MVSSRTINYPLLPCKLEGKDWKRKTCRSFLTKMLLFAGYSKCGQALGTGEAPLGWPDNILPWNSFKGASRSGLSTGELTAIVRSLFEAVEIDPDEHIRNLPERGDNMEEEIGRFLLWLSYGVV